MGILKITSESKALKRDQSFLLVLPKREQESLTVCYLLHGGGDDYTKWLRRTPLEQYANMYHVAFVLPEAGMSYYCDREDQRFSTYIFSELPAFLEQNFQFAAGQALIAGLSMGGYGSFKQVLTKPTQYLAAGSFSGDLDIAQSRLSEDLFTAAWNEERYQLIFGDKDQFDRSEENLYYLLAQKQELPFLYMSCGLSDPLLENNQAFYEAACKQTPITFETWAGAHDWQFWDESLRRFLQLAAEQGYVKEVGN
ncbi:alpha/beta hydrolase [Candidatus Enterococcus ferrettii]|uniref:Esterase n=1 Tax=Candidatus Enterococcus ferrettii TaxID=2815324 RepID=A0ABV0EMW7_9ENTE|nr:alpha/beta hydrolase-fold protein [Enterococcus sp. 665A]MBO1341615.1 hypothetical protein [Enterococcus sp. 665A]